MLGTLNFLSATSFASDAFNADTKLAYVLFVTATAESALGGGVEITPGSGLGKVVLLLVFGGIYPGSGLEKVVAIMYL